MKLMCSRRAGYVAILLALLAPQALGQALDILSGRPLDPSRLAAEPAASPVKVTAEILPPTGGRPAYLAVKATVDPPFYTYSTTQKSASATQISVAPSSDFKLDGPFQANKQPTIHQDMTGTQETFAPEVIWTAPLAVRPGIDPREMQIIGTVRIQACRDGSCLAPEEKKFVATLGGSSQAPPMPADATATLRASNGHVTISGRLEPKVAAPGTTAKLILNVEVAPGWHLYEFAKQDSQSLGYKPTLLGFTTLSGLQAGTPTADKQPMLVKSQIPGAPDQRYYLDGLTVTTPIEIPLNASPGQFPIDGYLGFQVCNEMTCDPPLGARFAVTLNVGDRSAREDAQIVFANAKYAEASALATARMDVPDGGANSKGEQLARPNGDRPQLFSSLSVVVLASLLGGLILNFMPCVLPVIGLKILSFTEQAGRHRSHVLLLNLWYSLGILTVFWILATLAAAMNLGWGQQFQSTRFNVVMSGVVFVMALSFLGVWEIPIPGFVGGSKASGIAAREGALGAFVKGCLTTILATPCSGPFLGSVFGYLLNQPPAIIYLVFTCIGLGMSAPYLVMGAFPSLIRFLPKPGAWMDTFKQLMGFVLLGTIVYFFSVMDRDYLVPTFAMLVGLWAGCWWIGRTPLYENLGRKLLAWGEGAAFAAVITFAAFNFLGPREHKIPWKNFSVAQLENLNATGHTVLVDFTAEWCWNCKWNLYTAIETEDVKQALAQNRVVPLLADWTKPSDEIKQTLESLQSNSIPILAVYPADRTKPPIVLRDLISKQDVLKAIEQAGPSQPNAATASMP